jgi:3-methyl-2-oxobutanoate hydroxymethyltransferase
MADSRRSGAHDARGAHRGDAPPSERSKVTVLTLRKQKRTGRRTVLVTAYDYPQALLADRAGVDAILVGDSLGMTTFGHKTTLPVTMAQMLPHCEAVARANQSAFLIGDMPFMSYQESSEVAVRNAGRFLRAGMDCVKLEGPMPERVEAISRAGMLVMGHLGLTPQSQAKLGGYRVQGKTKAQADVVLEQAKTLQDAGCAFLLLEAMPVESARYVASQLEIPVYGIGAGDAVDGQLVILHDIVGLFFEFQSKFVKRYCDAGEVIRDALYRYAADVREGTFPGPENFYEIRDEELERIVADARRICGRPPA